MSIILQCDNCNKIFSSRQRLMYHENKKGGCSKEEFSLDTFEISNVQSNYICSICGKIFRDGYNLNRHQLNNPKSKCFVKM